MFGLRGLGQLESAASASLLEEDEIPPAASDTEELSWEVVGESDPLEDDTVREWLRILERDDVDGPNE
ncbi:MAG: hypothetical protein V1876_00355 [Candidatus Peregrinibacteria bacterium]